MKTTKHIEKIAEKLTKYEQHKDITLNWSNPFKYRQHSKEYISKELTKIKNALLNGRFYAGVVSVSRSGMSRKIKMAYIYKNELITIRDPKILKLAGVNKNGSISGCGMDMLFHAQYTLFHNLHTNYKKANYQNRLKPYKNY
tara:strand:- start:176 stop:601 length:426 start_codon:yes stop_codon:yes gene_type:complete